MSFEQITPRPFTAEGIQNYAPPESGVYGISNAQEWIYIGTTPDIRDALLAHLREPGTALMDHQPTGFVFEICRHGQQTQRRNHLVVEYHPSCNRGQERPS